MADVKIRNISGYMSIEIATIDLFVGWSREGGGIFTIVLDTADNGRETDGILGKIFLRSLILIYAVNELIFRQLCFE